MAVEHIRKWQVGNVEIVRIVEINAHQDPFTMLSSDFTPEIAMRHPWLAPNFMTPDGAMKISFQCFVVRSGNERIMIDTCIGNDREREFPVFSNLQGPFLEDLAAAGYPRETITKVICTHLHSDHVGWNTMKVNGRFVPTFPNARYLFGRKEYDAWQAMKRDPNNHHDMRHIVDAVEPVMEAGIADFVEPNAALTDEVSLFPTPGHTPGHVSIRIVSNGKEAIITGDMMHHPLQFAEPDFHNNFDLAPDKALLTRRAFYASVQDSDILVIGTHFCDPTSGYVVREGKAWKLKVAV
jgi:glyoxylase-like metal-dependent hydrolase (beta-lactamase superfamily II)